MALTRIAPAGIGTTPEGSGFNIGSSNLHGLGLDATNAKFTGIVTSQNIRVLGDLQVDGTTTTLDTVVTSVDKLEVEANNTTVAVAITQSGSGDGMIVLGGNLGVGTASPSQPLHVEGNARITGILSVGQGTITLDSSQNMIKLGALTMHRDGSSGDAILMNTGGTYNPFRASKFLIDAVEVIDNSKVGKNFSKIGIGTAVPTYALQVNNSSIPRIHLTNNTTGTTTSDGFQIYMNGNDAMILNKENSLLQFGTNNATHATLTGAGDFGLGTNNPAAPLHVLSSSYPTTTIQRNHAVNYPRLRLINTSNHGADLDGIGDGSPAGGFRISTITGGTSTERMRIDGSGNVEVHNSATSAQSRISAHGFTCRDNWGAVTNMGNGMMSPASNTLAFTTNSIERLRIDSDGRLIAGGATASNAWTGGDDLILGNTTSGTRTGITLVSHSGSDGGIYWSDGTSASAYRGQIAYNHANDTMSLYTAAAARLLINSDGIVLINDAAVSSNRGDAPLQIETGANGNALNLRARAGDNIYSYLNFQNNAGSQTAAHIYLQRDASNNAGTLVFGTAAASANTPTERLKIHSSGATTMHVNSASHETFRFTTQGVDEAKLIMRDASDNDDIVLNTGGNSWINSGNFGIGDNNPDTKLTVKAGSGNQLRLDNAGERYTQISLRNNGSQKAALWFDNTNNQFDIYGSTNIGIRLLTNGTERLRVKSDGTVLMGGQTGSYDGGFVNLELRKDSNTVGGSMTLVNATASQAGATCEIDCYQNYRGAGKIVFGRENGNNWQSSASSAASFIAFHTNNSGTIAERVRITAAGRTLIGGQTASEGSHSNLQVREDGFGRNVEIFRSYNSGTTPARIRFSNSRGTAASPAIVASGDMLAEIRFNGYDGTNYDTQAAKILASVDGTPSLNDMPGKLAFFTTADGESNPTERFTVDSSGMIRHSGGHANQSGNMAASAYYRIVAGTSVPASSSITFVISGLASGWMTIRSGGYSNAGQSQYSLMYQLGGYMTATSTYNVVTVQEWGNGVTISTSKNASDYRVTLTNNSGSYALNSQWCIEGSNSGIKIRT